MNNKKVIKLVIGGVGLLVMSLSLWTIAEWMIASVNGDEQIAVTDMDSKTMDKVERSLNGHIEEAVMTIDALSYYDGLEERPAYIAVDDLVYDVTNLEAWEMGQHYGLVAGQDLTEAFKSSPHTQTILSEATIVGRLEDQSGQDLMGQKLQTEEDKIKAVDEATIARGDQASVDVMAEEGRKMDTGANQVAFSLEELGKYNGRDGNAAYIAVEGWVYDVSQNPSWQGGGHGGYFAGQDLTDAFMASPHNKSMLDDLVLVGSLLPQSPTLAGPLEVQSKEQVAENNQESISQGDGLPLATGSETSVLPVMSEEGTWSLEKMAPYNGQNGMPAYIAVKGSIYDVTGLAGWANGSHHGYRAGQDLTNAFDASPHAISILDGARLIGTLEDERSIEAVISSEVVEDRTNLWTLESLSLYDGRNNYPAYIAVDDLIYDVGGLEGWSGGSHQGYSAGQDLTTAFAASPHSGSTLSRAPIVGRLGDPIDPSLIQGPTLVQDIYDEEEREEREKVEKEEREEKDEEDEEDEEDEDEGEEDDDDDD